MRYALQMRAILVLPLCLCLALGSPVSADGPEGTRDTEQQDGIFGLLDRLLRGFMDDVDPHMRQMERSLEMAEPELRRLLGQLRDMVEYDPPEILPNGDILIRRRQTTPDPDAEGQADPAPPDSSDDAPSPFEL